MDFIVKFGGQVQAPRWLYKVSNFKKVLKNAKLAAVESGYSVIIKYSQNDKEFCFCRYLGKDRVKKDLQDHNELPIGLVKPSIYNTCCMISEIVTAFDLRKVIEEGVFL